MSGQPPLLATTVRALCADPYTSILALDDYGFQGAGQKTRLAYFEEGTWAFLWHPDTERLEAHSDDGYHWIWIADDHEWHRV